jgi:capsular exopolysaccharide synthesis family protein
MNNEPIDFSFNWQEYFLKWQRQWKTALGVFGLTIFLSLVGSSFLKKNYQAQGKILFRVDRTASLTGVGKNVEELKALSLNQTPVITEIEVIRSIPLLKETIERVQVKNAKAQPLRLEDVKDRLKMKMIGGSDVVQISYQDPNPHAAADVVNTLMNVYLDSKIDNNRSQAKTAREFISKSLPNIEQKVAQAEQELLDFKQGNKVLSLTKEAEITVIQMANLDQKITDLKAEIEGIDAQIAILKAQLGLTYDEALAVNRVSNSPAIEAILAQIKKVEVELADRRKNLQDNHPQILNLKEQRAKLDWQFQSKVGKLSQQKLKVLQGLLQVKNFKENLLERFIDLQSRKVNRSQQLASLKKDQKKYQERAQLIPKLESRQQYLNRKINSAQNTYETLLDNFQVVQVTENKETVSARIIETARFPERGSTGRLPVMAGGTLLAFLLAQLTVLIREQRDKTIKNIAELKDIFGYHVLSLIPLDESNSNSTNYQLVTIEQPEAFESELYRMLQVNLRLFNPESQAKVILVTSSVPEEGKSTITANLAASIAETKGRVLLIDGDLRNPSQAKFWTQCEPSGLSDVLSGKARLREVICHPIDKLDLLAAGKTKVSPLTLIDSEEMVDLLQQLKQEYDVILIDTPPLLVTADVLTLGKMADGILLISRLGVVERETAKATQESLKSSGQQVLGLVVNGVNRQEFDRYLYYAKKYYGTQRYQSKSVFAAKGRGVRV